GRWLALLHIPHPSHMSCPALFCSVLRRPPRLALFPYTTLFRSVPVRLSGDGLPGGRGDAVDRSRRSETCHHRRAGDGGRGRHRQDRKSTRLNSSHVKISYGVFCLKKKREFQAQKGTTPARVVRR